MEGEWLKGKNAVVTGAGGGIGREIVLALARQGAGVVVNDIGAARNGSGTDTQPADKVVAEVERLGRKAVANYDSVADFEAAQRIIKCCVDNFGRIDILVNCAGNLRESMIFNMSAEDWDSVVKVHLYGTFNCCRHASGFMRDQGYGRIINIVSGAWLGTVGQCNYGAAKAGIVGLTRAIARELGRYGVTCNAVAPLAATRMTVDEKVKAGWHKRYEAGIITKEKLDSLLATPGPEWVPPIVVYLATEEAANINGQVFRGEAERISIYSQPAEVKTIYRNRKKEGAWSVDELVDLVPQTLLVGYTNPAPPQA